MGGGIGWRAACAKSRSFPAHPLNTQASDTEALRVNLQATCEIISPSCIAKLVSEAEEEAEEEAGADETEAEAAEKEEEEAEAGRRHRRVLGDGSEGAAAAAQTSHRGLGTTARAAAATAVSVRFLLERKVRPHAPVDVKVSLPEAITVPGDGTWQRSLTRLDALDARVVAVQKGGASEAQARTAHTLRRDWDRDRCRD